MAADDPGAKISAGLQLQKVIQQSYAEALVRIDQYSPGDASTIRAMVRGLRQECAGRRLENKILRGDAS